MKNEASTKKVDNSPSEHADLLANLHHKTKDELIAILLQHLKEGHGASDVELRSIVATQESMLPSSIFANDHLSALETIVKFLKENRNFTLHRIATVLHRDDRSIWTTYNNASKKMKGALNAEPSSFFVPAQIFAERNLSVLETLTQHLKDRLGMSYHDIAVALHRDDRTIWTVYKRAQKKLGGAA
ncbi:MAG: hypothetical protein AABY13_00540 [Nanoarchaeota archaeon]